VAARFGLIAAAGEFATESGITGWPSGEASNAAARCFQDWLATRGTTGNKELSNMLAKVKSFLEQHGDSRITDWDDPQRITINRLGYRKQTNDGQEFFVLPESFRLEMCKGMDHKAVAALLLKHGAITPDAKGNATRSERLREMGNQRCYRINPKIWELQL
jgi:putative DNA primase/helicase